MKTFILIEHDFLYNRLEDENGLHVGNILKDREKESKIIIAAPDLLRELENAKRIISILDDGNPALKGIINAINKAKGL